MTPRHPRLRHVRRATAIAAMLLASGATGWCMANFVAPPLGAPDLEAVRAALKLRLPRTPIDAISCKDLGGLCEVTSKTTLFYVDAAARYLVIGRIYDMESRQDLTAARLLERNPDLLAAGAAGARASDEDPAPRPGPANEQIRKVSLAGLRAKGAIIWGTAAGPKVVVFSDFHCGYCKRLSAELKKIGARVEERPISIFGAASRKLAEQVLCAPSPEAALHAAYDGKTPPPASSMPQRCDTSGLDTNEAFAKTNGFGGTPVLVRPSDGAVIEGYRPASELRAWLAPNIAKNKK